MLHLQLRSCGIARLTFLLPQRALQGAGALLSAVVSDENRAVVSRAASSHVGATNRLKQLKPDSCSTPVVECKSLLDVLLLNA